MTVIGNTNDYFGKSLSGATLSIKIPEESTFESDKNIITGNVALYGATSGKLILMELLASDFVLETQVPMLLLKELEIMVVNI